MHTFNPNGNSVVYLPDINNLINPLVIIHLSMQLWIPTPTKLLVYTYCELKLFNNSGEQWKEITTTKEHLRFCLCCINMSVPFKVYFVSCLKDSNLLLSSILNVEVKGKPSKSTPHLLYKVLYLRLTFSWVPWPSSAPKKVNNHGYKGHSGSSSWDVNEIHFSGIPLENFQEIHVP